MRPFKFFLSILTPFCLFLLLFTMSPTSVSAQHISRELSTGWFPRHPYQMETQRNELTAVTGLDIQIVREAFSEANYRVSFQAMSWHNMVEGLKNGSVDFIAGAYYDTSRKDFAYFSVPYRMEQNALYYRHGLGELRRVRTMEELSGLLHTTPLRIAVNEDYAYACAEFSQFMEDPPANITLVHSDGYSENIRLLAHGEADIMVSNPIIIDRMLAEADHADVIAKSRLDMGNIPVHIMYSKANFTKEEVDLIDGILNRMKKDGNIRSMHINYVLPVYLTITTGQSWFILLNYLGIIAFCISGVILARKERYNLFGALLLAILPAIGGGVLRDLLMGASHVFVLENPGYMLFAVAIVLISFLFFRLYDFLQGRSGEVTKKLDLYADKTLSGVFDRIYKLLDAWAVAAFTIIGVSVAIELQSDPLWLWGPAMGVLTASGGVLLRDIVRADFNIAILKQDSYAEISLLGGILYTITLLYLPVNTSLEIIFYLTIVFIAVLFGFRFFVLWKGYDNPWQFGAIHTNPRRRLEAFTEYEPGLWQLLTKYYGEDQQGNAVPVYPDKLEHLHNQFLYTHAKLRNALNEVASEPLSTKNVKAYRNCSARLDIASSTEENLYVFLQLPLGITSELSGEATEFLQRLHESLKTNIDVASATITSGDTIDFQLLETIVSQHQERFNQLRNNYSRKQQEKNDPTLNALLQTTHKVERIIYLISTYVSIVLGKKDLDAGLPSNRKIRQALMHT